MMTFAIFAIAFDFLCNDFWFHQRFEFYKLPVSASYTINIFITAIAITIWLCHIFTPFSGDFGMMKGLQLVTLRVKFFVLYAIGFFVYEFQFLACVIPGYMLRLHPDFTIFRFPIELLYLIYIMIIATLIKYIW
jgi:hypothetical protein